MDARAIDIMHELETTNTALQIAIAERDAARKEVVACHQYLDECHVNSSDEAEPIPLVERLATLVKELATARAEVARATVQLATLPQYCCCCGKEFLFAQLNGLCDECYEDRIA